MSGARRIPVTRRDLLRALGVAATGSLVGCWRSEPAKRDGPDPIDRLTADGSEPEVLRVGVTPTQGKSTAVLFEPLVRYLSEERGLRATVVAATTYDEVALGVQKGELDAAFLSPLAYVKARATLPAALVASVARSGSPTYLGYLVVRAGDVAESLSDLRGKRIAYVERGSTSGYLCPRALCRARGLDPDTFFGEAKFLGNHAAVITAVANGEADVGATASAFVDPERFDRVKEADQLKVIAKTARIPLDCAVVHQRLSKRLGRRWRDALLGFASSQAESEALAHSWGVSGFVAADDGRYDELAAMLTAEPSP